MSKIVVNEKMLRILTLYLDNYNKNLHGRGIAAKLRMNQRTVRIYLERLVGMNVFRAEIRGRHREFYLDMKNPLAKNFLELAEGFRAAEFLATKPVLRLLFDDARRGVEFYGSLAVFGSHVKGYATKESDIDVLLVGKISKGNEAGIGKIGKRHGKDISLKIVTKKGFEEALRRGDRLAKEIVKDHILIKGKDDFVDILWGYFEGTV